MKPNEIRSELVLRGITISSIAKQGRVSGSMVSQVVSGKKCTPRIQAAIADAIGVPIEEIFPVTKEAA